MKGNKVSIILFIALILVVSYFASGNNIDNKKDVVTTSNNTVTEQTLDQDIQLNEIDKSIKVASLNDDDNEEKAVDTTVNNSSESNKSINKSKEKTEEEHIDPKSTDSNNEDKENKDNKDKIKKEAVEDTSASITQKDNIKEEKENVQQEEVVITSASETQKDKYLTSPVPEGQPEPVEWQDTVINKDNKMKVTLSVTCNTILDNMDKLDKNKVELVPEDGVIYAEKEVVFDEGESVFDVLLREMQSNKIHMEFVMTPMYNSNYIEGINNLYEFDCGELSGWMYKVNGWFPNYGCSRYMLKDGDKIEWIYTCDLGRDIGQGFVEESSE